MFNWFRPKPIETPKAARSFFSTDIHIDQNDSAALELAWRKSFQRDPPKRPVDANGVTVAMDDMDSEFMKPDFGLGYGSTSWSQIGWYASQGFIGYQVCAMMAQHWLIDKACRMPARDAIRHGYDLTVNDGSDVDPKIIDKIKERDRKFGLKKHAVEFIHMGRVFGIRIALPIVDYSDANAYEKPFNIDGVRPGSYRGITQIDPYWITPELSAQSAANPSSMFFYEPEWWRVNGRRIHRSHLIIFKNGHLASVLKPSYLYGGIPVPQKLAERVYAAERTANEAPMLSLSKRSTVIHTDLEAALANQYEFHQRMKFWSDTRDNFGIKILGKEDVAEQFDISLADFDVTIMTQYQLVAAAADVPATKLLGTSPKGFNATGDYEMESYNQELESLQENDMGPLIERHHLLLMKSEFPELGFRLVLNWNPVDTPGAKEQADINLVKAQTGAALVTSGAVDGTDERERIIADKDSGYNGLDPVVPMGPGDREHEQEMQTQMLEAQKQAAVEPPKEPGDKPKPGF